MGISPGFSGEIDSILDTIYRLIGKSGSAPSLRRHLRQALTPAP